MILVTTAGKVGAQTARLLAAQSRSVRIIVRNPDEATALTAAGVDVVRGDLGDPNTIDRAVTGVDAIVLVSPGLPDQETTVVDSAARANVRHVVKVTSDASADSPIARRRDHHAIEVHLRDSGVPHTLLRSNAYQQNFLMLAPSIAATDSFASPTGDGHIGMINSDDVAAVAAAVAGHPAEHAGQTYWLSGPESLTYADAAVRLTQVLGRTITHRHITSMEQVQQMIAAGVPATVAYQNTQALELFTAGDSDWTSDDVERLLHRPPSTFLDFVREHSAQFRPTVGLES